MKRLRKGQTSSIVQNDDEEEAIVFSKNIGKKEEQSSTRKVQTIRKYESASSSSESESEDSDAEDRRARLRAKLLQKQKQEEESNQNLLNAMLEGPKQVPSVFKKPNLDKDENLPVVSIKKPVIKQEPSSSSEDDSDIERPPMRTSASIAQKSSTPIPTIKTEKPHFVNKDVISNESLSDESESEEDIRPIFISKNQRSTIKTEQQLEEEEAKRLEIEKKKQEQKRANSVKALEKNLKDEEISKRKIVTVDDELLSIDDSDDIDPEAERLAWIEREFKRLDIMKEERKKEEQEQTKSRKLKDLDIDDSETTRQNREEKKKMRFMQRYYHKGAFFMDNEEIATKAKEVALEPTGRDMVDYENMPKYYQSKNPGKSRQTKYTHLKDQDTTDFSSPWFQKKGGHKK